VIIFPIERWSFANVGKLPATSTGAIRKSVPQADHRSRRMPRTLQAVVLSTALLFGVGSTSVVNACPMCKVALEDNEDPELAARPKAYMYSILFMLSMPASLTAMFGYSFYRLSRQQQRLNLALLEKYSADDSQDSHPSA